MSANTLPADQYQQECEPDEFVLFYLKNRIEWDGKHTWYDAPKVRQQLTPKCAILKEAALLFEREKIENLKKMFLPLIESRNLNFQSFKYIFDSCFELLHERQGVNSESTSSVAISLLAILAFSGLYARRLAELDEEYGSKGEWKRDFRKEITQISIYASASLQAKLKTGFEKNKEASVDYLWDNFLDEIENWMNQIRFHNKSISSLLGRQLTQLFGNLPTPPATSVFVAAAALVLVASSIGAMMLGRRYLHLSAPT